MSLLSVDWVRPIVAKIQLQNSTFDGRDLDIDNRQSLRNQLFTTAIKAKYLVLIATPQLRISSCAVTFFVELWDKLDKKQGRLILVAWPAVAKQTINLIDPDLFTYFDTWDEAWEIILQKEYPHEIKKEYTLFHIWGQVKHIDVWGTLLPQQYLIGRHEDCNIRLDSNIISRKHAILDYNATIHQFQIQLLHKKEGDVSSPYNPVQMNDLILKKPTVVCPNDFISLPGDHTLFFRDNTPSTPPIFDENSTSPNIYEELPIATIKKFGRDFQNMFKDIEESKIDPDQMKILLRIYSLICPKLFEFATTKLDEICSLITYNLSLLFSHLNIIVIGICAGTKYKVIHVVHKNSNEAIHLPELLIKKSLDEETGFQFEYNHCNSLIIPLSKYGFLYIAKKPNKLWKYPAFAVLMANASSIATLISNGLLRIEQDEKENAKRDEIDAKRRQELLNPDVEKMRVPFLDICVYQQQLQCVGGDYYDIIGYDKQNWFIVLADCQGHGAQAAIIAVTLRAYLHQLILRSGECPNVAYVLNSADRILFEDFRNKKANYATCMLLHWNGASHILSFSGSFEHKHILYHTDTNQLGYFPPPLPSGTSGAALLGMNNVKVPFNIRQIRLHSGDTLLIYTDGLPETKIQSTAGDIDFGLSPIENVMRAKWGQPLKLIIEDILHAQRNFLGDVPMRDDMTILALRYNRLRENVPIIIPTK